MRRMIFAWPVLFVLAFSPCVAAQDTQRQTLAQLSTMLTAAPGTPGGKGLLTTVLAEARTAAIEATVAERVVYDLTAVKLQAGVVLAALDPALAKGVTDRFGVRPGVQAVVQQLTLLAQSDRKADAVRMLPDALTAAANVLRWCDAAIDAAQQIQGARTAEDVEPLVRRLTTLTRQLAAGTNIGKDRRPVPSATDGGLLYMQLQLQMLKVGRDAVAARPAAVAAPTDAQSQPRPPIPLVSTVSPTAAVSR